MQVVSVTRDKKHTVKITLKSGESFLLDLDLMAQYPLKVGSELDEDTIAELKEQSDYLRAKSRALWCLDRNEYTEKGLYDKLIKAGFDERASARAIARLCEIGLIDDERYARRRAQYYAENNVSFREIYFKLTQKGVPKELARTAIDELEVDEGAQIRATIERKYKDKLSTREDIQKVVAALCRKGFSYGAVRDCLKKYSEELKYEEY